MLGVRGGQAGFLKPCPGVGISCHGDRRDPLACTWSFFIESASDPNDLNRFVAAQADTYADALAEVQAGQKQTHWMWFVFPQLRGLGSSDMATLYGVVDADEARRYLAHPVLGPRLIEICSAALAVPERTAKEIFGVPDDAKLQSCATLFAQVAGDERVFEKVLERFFAGVGCERTLEMVG